jgi:transposase
MERRYGIAGRIWVMDRGMVSRKNLAWLKSTGRHYLIGTPRSQMRQWSRQIADASDWQTVREGIEVKLCAAADGEETYLLCRSAERREKEKAMHERFAQRLEKGLDKLGRRIERAKKPLDRSRLERQIGRLLGRNSRAAGRYTVELLDDPASATTLKLRWAIRPQWDEQARLDEGCYILRTNVTDWTPEVLWKTYIQLTEAEAAFRIHKSDLSIRPIWHHKQGRVEAHILVCFLAYVLWKTLEQWQARAALGNSPRTILEELGRIQSTDVVLPLADEPARELRIRCVVRPDKAQAALLDRLDLDLPDRLRYPSTIAKCSADS